LTWVAFEAEEQSQLCGTVSLGWMRFVLLEYFL